MTRWTVRRASRPCKALSFVDAPDIDRALSVARNRHGHHVTVDNLEAIRLARGEPRTLIVTCRNCGGAGTVWPKCESAPTDCTKCNGSGEP